jgi:hypothetical protein
MILIRESAPPEAIIGYFGDEARDKTPSSNFLLWAIVSKVH